MGPLVRRSWAPRGQTPVLMQRGRSRLKVSVIGALVISPRRRRVRAYFGIQAEASFDGERILQFLKQLCRALRVPIALMSFCSTLLCRAWGGLRRVPSSGRSFPRCAW